MMENNTILVSKLKEFANENNISLNDLSRIIDSESKK